MALFCDALDVTNGACCPWMVVLRVCTAPTGRSRPALVSRASLLAVGLDGAGLPVPRAVVVRGVTVTALPAVGGGSAGFAFVL